MTPVRSSSAFSVVFAVVYAVSYVICVENNFAVFTYFPVTGEFGMWVQPPNEGPAMYWYGWLLAAGIVASAAGLIACFLPEGLMQRLWTGWSWLVPLAAMLAFVYMLRKYFLP